MKRNESETQTKDVKDNVKRGKCGSRHKPNSNSKRNGSRNNKSKDELEQLSSNKKGDDINDSSFYYSDNILRDQITNYSFNQFAGVPFTLGKVNNSSVELQVRIPTIMRIKLNPNAGMNYLNANFDVTDGVYRAGLKNYYMLSAGNAKTTNYQPQDLTMLIFALTSIMEYTSFIQRILGTPYIYNVRNRDLPQKLIEVQNIQYNDLVSNMAAYRIRFNTILQMLNKVPIPSNVKAFMKSSALYANYYTDDTSPMAQFYVLMPDRLWQLNENVEPGILDTKIAVPNSPTLLSTILDQLKTMIDTLLSSATFNYIFADILRLAEKGSMKLLNYGLIPDGYVAPILYSHEFNLWIDNACIIDSPLGSTTASATGGNVVYSDIEHNSLRYSPDFTYGHTHRITEHVLNFDTNNPDIEDRIAATRLVAGWMPFGETCKVTCGTHYITSLQVYDNEDFVTIPTFNMSGYDSSSSIDHLIGNLRRFDVLSKFKHAPHMFVYNRDNTATDQITIDSSNYDYYTTVDDDYLMRMFDAEWLTYLSIE